MSERIANIYECYQGPEGEQPDGYDYDRRYCIEDRHGWLRTRCWNRRCDASRWAKLHGYTKINHWYLF